MIRIVAAATMAFLALSLLAGCKTMQTPEGTMDWQGAAKLVQTLHDAGFAGQFDIELSPYGEVGAKQGFYIDNASAFSASGVLNPSAMPQPGSGPGSGPGP